MKRLVFLGLILIIPLLSPAALKQPLRAKKGMVVSADRLASQVGIEILKRGGNAVDAAVAVGFALAVTFPQAGNIGGGGYMVIRMADGRTTSIDYREKAPGKASKDMFLDEHGDFVPARSQEGYLSVGVPGAGAGLTYGLEHYGTLSRKDVLQPAIDLAAKGFPIGHSFALDLKKAISSRDFEKYPATLKVFSKNGKPYEEGDTLVQKDLAETLKRIQQIGKDGFYKGKTADLVVAELKRGGGLISYEDLSSYQAIERPPVRGSYRGYEVISMGPSSSGGVVLTELLNLIAPYDIANLGFNSSRSISLMAEAMKLAYADRAEFLGDLDFYTVPVDLLTSKEYANDRRKLIDTLRAIPSEKILHGVVHAKEGSETTHYSVVDQWGNAVSVTTTINSWFGSNIVVDGAGFFLNNEMDDFAAKPGAPNQFGLLGGEANSVQPNKRMLSAMTPTIVLKDQKPFLVLGSPGGSTIITTVLQVILNVVDHGMNIREAIDAPRIHHQWYPDSLYYEKHGIPRNVIKDLKRRGYNLKERDGYQGRVEGIMIDPKSRTIYGASDPRGTGAAVGY